MSLFLLNILLAVVWVAETGQFTPFNFTVGFALGYLILWLVRSVGETPRYFTKVPQVIFFVFFFLWELVRANLRVAYYIVAPGHRMRPGVVAIPLDVQTEAEITLLANLITLTPGTLSLDVSSDRKVLYVHGMTIDNVEQFRRRIKEGFEKRILEVFR